MSELPFGKMPQGQAQSSGGLVLGAPMTAPPPPQGSSNAFLGNICDLLIASLIAQGSTGKMMELALRDDIFTEPERPYYQALVGFVRRHGTMPSRETYIAEVRHPNLPFAPEPPSFYAEKLRDRFIRDGATQSLLQLSNQIKTGASASKALEAALQGLLRIKQGAVTHGLYDAREMASRVIPTYQHNLMHADETAVHLGWDYTDRISAGIVPGDILSWIGRPATGKTWLNLQSAIYPWLHQHKRTMFVTTEMLRGPIEERVASMVSRLPIRGIHKSSLSSPQFKVLKDRLYEISTHDAPLWVVDANLGATVQDLWALCSMLGVEWLVIDGAYLLTHPDKRMDRYTRVAENCRLLKSEIATGLRIPLAASWQFSREMSKKKNAKGKKNGDEKPGLEDIGYSDEIGQISSLVLATLEAESIETQNRRRIDVMKGRNGETGGFFINWDFNNMDFSEHVQLTHEALRFI